MARFSYHATDQGGKTVTGVLEADSVEAASDRINQDGLIPLRVRPASTALLSTAFQTLGGLLNHVPPRDVIVFTKQFSTMTRAGIPVLSLLDILESQTENRRLRSVVATMKRDVQDGVNLTSAFAKHSAIFSDLYVSMVQAGEASGALPDILDRLTYIIRHEHKVRSDVRAAIRYPLFVFAFLVFGFFVLQFMVVPRFAAIFRRAGVTLPLPTRICIGLHEFLLHYWVPGLIVAVVAVTVLVLWQRTPHGRYARALAFLKAPLVGPLMLKSLMSRFSSIFSILQASGVPVLDAMDILSATIGNPVLEREFRRVQLQLSEGKGIAQPLRSAAYFTPMVVNMIAIGEETGALDEMLREVAGHYDMEVEYGTQRLSDAIGPILTVTLSALVGFFALAIYMPMWDLAKMVK
jgi:type IV pilus assembly protein PilC